MNTTDRRNWLKTIALGGGFTLLGGMPSMAAPATPRRMLAEGPAKLNSNENPFGPSDAVRKALAEQMDLGCRYPFQHLDALEKLIAEKEEVPASSVVVTGGSTEGLQAAGLIYGLQGGEIIAADPTFQSLLTYAEQFGAYVHRVPLNETLHHDLDAMEQRITSRTRLIFICNPNNPSGTLLDAGKLKDFIYATDHRAVIFSDEAYYDYISIPDYPSMVDLVKEGRNVIVSKTFSKVYGLAGLRIGYLIARPDIASRLREALMANTNILAILAAQAALKDDEFYRFSLTQNEQAKEHIYRELNALNLPFIESHTNFVFFRTGRDIRELGRIMAGKNVLIGRPFPPLNDWARISTGRMDEVKAFTEALRQVMAT